jgi:hypothetical protein
MPLVEEFVKAFGVWDVAQPYIERIVEEPEMRLIVAMDGQALTVEEAAERLGMTPAEAAAFLERCYQRGVVRFLHAPRLLYPLRRMEAVAGGGPPCPG